MMDMTQRARTFALAAHGARGQLRKYTNEPYIVHPAAVAQMVYEVQGTPEMVAAAWLHDVVEDTDIPIELIEEEFGATVALYVTQLTNVTTLLDGPRSYRIGIEVAHIAEACPQAKTIKLADLIDNTSTIVSHDPKFAKVYMNEKKKMLRVLLDGNAMLLAKAVRIVDEWEAAQEDKEPV